MSIEMKIISNCLRAATRARLGLGIVTDDGVIWPDHVNKSRRNRWITQSVDVELWKFFRKGALAHTPRWLDENTFFVKTKSGKVVSWPVVS